MAQVHVAKAALLSGCALQPVFLLLVHELHQEQCDPQPNRHPNNVAALAVAILRCGFCN